MSDQIVIIFLGINDAGMRIYDWLCDRENVFVHSLLTTEVQLQAIEEVQPDYVVSCGYRHMVPEEILDIPEGGCLNLHASYLPYNRGANPNVWSIVEGTPAGVSLHWMDDGIDTGDIIAQREVEIGFSDNGKDLYERVEDAQLDLFRHTWPDIVAGETNTTKQCENAGTYHTKKDFEELCELNPNEEVRVRELLDRLRALTFPPYDNAKIEIDGETYYVEIDISR